MVDQISPIEPNEDEDVNAQDVPLVHGPHDDVQHDDLQPDEVIGDRRAEGANPADVATNVDADAMAHAEASADAGANPQSANPEAFDPEAFDPEAVNPADENASTDQDSTDQDSTDQDSTDQDSTDQDSTDDEPDSETSLDALAAAYAGLVGGGVPAASAEPAPPGDKRSPPEKPAEEKPAELEKGQADQQVSPLGILEAVLFVGNSENEPLTAKRIAALMRGVSPREIDAMVVELNEQYRKLEAPYEVVSQGAGYLLNIRSEYAGLRDRFYGSVREARLSQAAIDILAVIAYGQPLTREQIDESRGKPSGGILSQLVRRQLLRVERPDEKPRRPLYSTTERFLQIMGLDDISELPESQEFDRTF